MASEARRKIKTKKREKNRSDNAEVTKEEFSVAKFVRFNCPTKKATIMGDEMSYFTANKAVDCLMASKWTGDGEKKLFSNRHGCVFYMQTLLEKGLFFRAKKLVPKKKDVKQIATSSTEAKIEKVEAVKETTLTKRKEGKDAKKKTDAKKEDIKEKEKEPEEVTAVRGFQFHLGLWRGIWLLVGGASFFPVILTSGKKKTKKIKFDIHQNQTFNDGNDIYVWKYDPTPTKKFLLGLAMVFGSIGVCLFPLWPHEVRLGVYYLSVAAMVFVGVIIFLVALRSVLFGAVWLFTFGKRHFWLLPNLTEDCGFFDSFKPLYSHTLKGASPAIEKKEEPKHTDDDSKIGQQDEQEDDSNSGGDQDGKISDEDDDGEINDLALDGKRGVDGAGPPESSDVSASDVDGGDDDFVVEAVVDEIKAKRRRVKRID